jgi:hypothetical protein
VLASLVSETASHVLQATQVVQVGQTVSEPLQISIGDIEWASPPLCVPPVYPSVQGGPVPSVICELVPQRCNASLSVRPTWTGMVTVQHVTWFVDTMCDDNRSPACEKA